MCWTNSYTNPHLVCPDIFNALTTPLILLCSRWVSALWYIGSNTWENSARTWILRSDCSEGQWAFYRYRSGPYNETETIGGTIVIQWMIVSENKQIYNLDSYSVTLDTLIRWLSVDMNRVFSTHVRHTTISSMYVLWNHLILWNFLLLLRLSPLFASSIELRYAWIVDSNHCNKRNGCTTAWIICMAYDNNFDVGNHFMQWQCVHDTG